MNICMICKYPPIQGGVSRNNFWEARRLAQLGHQVHVVTNAFEVEDEFRLQLSEEDFAFLEVSGPEVAGSIRVHSTVPVSHHAITHIPFASPYVSKMTTLALDVIRQEGCSVILASYVEPYGVAAMVASKLTGVPYSIIHAGSDVGRLMRLPELNSLYQEVFRNAQLVRTGQRMFPAFRAIGVRDEQFFSDNVQPLPLDHFNPQAEPMQVEKEARRRHPAESLVPQLAEWNAKPFDHRVPTIGMYGKIGTFKGTYDLVRALGALKREGKAFQFVYMGQGADAQVRELAALLQECDVTDRSWWLPFLPHWKVPSLIRRCAAVCFLERDFPISIHTPSVPQEVFACGTPLVLSREIAEKQPFELSDGEHCLIVDDPKDQAELAAALRRVLEQPERAADIGRAGYAHFLNRMGDAERPLICLTDLLERMREREEEKRTMSLLQMQTCVAKLVTDESFRMLFAEEPEKALAFYELTERETASLKELDREDLEKFAVSLRKKRFLVVDTVFAQTFSLVRDEVVEEWKRFYCHLYPNPMQSREEVEAFSRFLTERCREESPLVKDLALFDRVFYAIMQSSLPTETLAVGGMAAESAKGSGCPRLHASVQIEEFEHDVMRAVEAIRKGDAVPELPKQPSIMVFARKPFRTEVHPFRINPLTRDLLRLCDGSRPVAELVALVEEKVQRRGLEEPIRSLLSQLTAKGVLVAGEGV